MRLRDISDIGLVLKQSKVAGIFGFFDAHESQCLFRWPVLCGHDVFQSFQISFDNATFFPEGDAAFLAKFDEGFSFLVFVIFEPKHVDNLAFVSGKITDNDAI